MTDPRGTYDYDIEVHDLDHPVAPEPVSAAPEPGQPWSEANAWDGSVSAPAWAMTPPPTAADPDSVTPEPIKTDERPRRRIPSLPRKLATRLVVGVVALVIVVVTASGFGTALLLHRFLLQRLDQQVEATANSASVFRIFGPMAPNTLPVRAPQEVWATALQEDGSLLLQPTSSAYNALNLSSATAKKLVSRESLSPVTVTTTDGKDLRVVARHTTGAFTINGNTDTVTLKYVAVIGLDTAEVNNTMHQLLVLEFAIGGAAVVIAFLLSAYGVRLSLRQLNRVTNTAREVTAELSSEGAGLDRRVPVTETDTEVGQLATSVNTLLETVETEFAARIESEDRMRQFLADASHELRTPLTSIRGYAELARMRRNSVGGDNDSEDADTLARIESEGTRMSRLVDDLLTLARTDQANEPGSETSFQPVDIDALVDDAVRGARAAFPLRRIDIATAPGLAVDGDHDQLVRVVRNLINNAAVHTKPEGAIRVRADLEGTDVVLRVDDEGPGLTPEEAAHVFERFWRADKARTRAKGGSGLGLSIVTSIVAAHGGTASFDSTPQTGSTVTVRLPALSDR
jgi:two-component system OmpR family sensor kinase